MSDPGENRWRVNTHINIGTLVQTIIIVVGGMWAVFQVENTLNEKIALITGNLTTFEAAITGEMQDLHADLRAQAARMDTIEALKTPKQ